MLAKKNIIAIKNLDIIGFKLLLLGILLFRLFLLRLNILPLYHRYNFMFLESLISLIKINILLITNILKNIFLKL